MAKPKYKITGFTRFFIFMLFFLPIAYFGLSFAKGESPDSFVNRVKSKIEKITNRKSQTSQITEQSIDIIAKKDEEIQKLREELFQCQNKK